jgi:hypothetical protein
MRFRPITHATHAASSYAKWVARLIVVQMLAGCSADLRIPDADGEPCAVDADCNPMPACGTIRLCISGHCEVEDAGSGRLPCPDAGLRVPMGEHAMIPPAR